MTFSDYFFFGSRLASIEAKLDLLLAKEKKMAATLDTLVADVTAQTGVINSAVTLLTTLKTELDAALATGDLGKVQQVSDSLGANTKALADAVAANPA